jgi:VanZ family protein
MSVIFTASTDSFSSQRTSRFIGPLLRWLVPGIEDRTIRQVQLVVRKTGHATEYAVLAWLFWRAFRQPRRFGDGPWPGRVALLSFGLCVLYAVTDEVHQQFVPSRQGSAADVLLDASGAALGLGVVFWLWRRKQQSRGRRSSQGRWSS